MIRVSQTSYQYPGGTRIAFPDFHIPRGNHGLLLGNSGSGKTTLIHLIGGLLRGQQGKVEVGGVDMASLTEQGLDQYRGRHFGFVFQKNHLIQALTVEQNLLAAPFFAGLPQNSENAEALLQELGLEGKRQARIRELSHGQAQRVAIARALINKPTVILADEPTSALDDKNCDKVIRLLMEASTNHGATLVVATHDQRLKSVMPVSVELVASG
ncbi:MAG: ATP-binding cassette domain-containing protein [Cyclobacteriaceae bacterium]|nr:ATP-binding cassette domain-containing protein [Cyclobacteriaceae bacterium]